MPSAVRTAMHRLGTAVIPPRGVARRLALRSASYSLGTGVFLTGGVVFFTQIAGLDATQIGVGFSLSGAVALVLGVPLGGIADRFGTRRVWALAGVAEGVVFLCYPFVRGFAVYLAVMFVMALVQTVGGAARGAYTLGAVPPGDRVVTLAYVRSALNIGFSLGALLGGGALAIGTTTVVSAMPALTGVLLLGTAVAVFVLPDPEREEKASGRSLVFLVKDVRFVVLAVLNGLLATHDTLLFVVLPLWLISRTDAPHWVLAAIILLNTVLVVLLQVPASRGSDSLVGAGRTAVRASMAIGAACVVAIFSQWTDGGLTIAVIAAAALLFTLGELFQASAGWGMVSLLTPDGARGSYQGLWSSGNQLIAMLAPALLTALVIGWNVGGWLLAALLVVAAGIATRVLGGAAGAGRGARATVPES